MSAVERPFIISPGPHIRVVESTTKIMWTVNASLAPAALWGVFVFGWPALWVLLASVGGAIGAEHFAGRAMKSHTSVRDGSAVCTGLLLAMTLPPLVPFWMAAVGSIFAILFGKMIFGGLGFNLFNPALIGRAFMMATFPLPMSSGWAPPRPGLGGPLDALTTPTPLGALREQGLAAAEKLIGGPGNHWLGLALGFRPGSIGEVSALLILLGAAFLLLRGIIKLTIPLAVFAGVAVSTAFSGNAALHLMTGGLWLGAFYMATDYVTSPNQRNGQIVFGLLVGGLTGLIRLYGGYPEGICYAILLANTLVPALNTWFRPQRPALLKGAPA